MLTTMTADNAGIVLHSAVNAARSEIPDTSSLAYPNDMDALRKELEHAYDKVWNKILDCYEFFAELRDKSPLPFLIDPDGSAVNELEKTENLLRKSLEDLELQGENLERIAKVTQAAIDIFQNVRWIVMVNDGLLENGSGEKHKDGKSFMASMGL